MRNHLLTRTSAALAAIATAVLAAGATTAQAATNDPLSSKQWGLGQIRAEQAWATATGRGAVVAVVDTGLDLTHPDLKGRLVRGATFTGCKNVSPCGNGDYRGPDGVNNGDEHGTHVAGIVAATRGNGIGIAGVAPNAKIMPVKVLEDGSGSSEEIAAGIRWATANGADVINLSLGSLPGGQAFNITGLDTEMQDAIAEARAAGVVTVAAAGNSTTPLCNDPAFGSTAICVVSTDRNELRSWFSDGAIKPDLKTVTAPGGAGLVSCDDDIWSTVPVGTGSAACGQKSYDAYAGTSMATPHVAGVAAMLVEQGRSVQQIEDTLMGTARQPVVGTRGVFTPTFGYGIVDAQAAVTS